jgi:hypothetical protein
VSHPDGSPADPPTVHVAVPNWRPGDTIALALAVVLVGDRRPDPDQPPALVVEDMAE